MNMTIKNFSPISIAVTCLILTQVAWARDYVPPPSGPYQSSVVINHSTIDGEPQQVYKFPPADILTDGNAARGSGFLSDSGPGPDDTEQKQPDQERRVGMIPPQSTLPGAGNQLAPGSSPYQWQVPQTYDPYQSSAPAWNGYNTGNVPAYKQNVWQQTPQYGYAPQYPYSYGQPNQYNANNYPFYGMPSPWNVMPKNPFFSDR